MTGNFDYNTNIDIDTAELLPFWEVSEAEYIADQIHDAMLRYDWAISASDWDWETHFNTLNTMLKEAEADLAYYGVSPREYAPWRA